MRLAIMQPYFFPYLGYFALIKHSDQFIAFDVVQFIRHGWIERNRILKPQEGWQYIRVPLVKHSREALIRELQVRTQEPWQDQILRQLEHYKKSAPYYSQVLDFASKALSYKTESIGQLNLHVLGETCRYLGVPFNGTLLSQMDIDYSPASVPDEWALNVCLALHADSYVNPPGAMDLFDREKYTRAGVKFDFLKVGLAPYDQRRSTFEPGLSILDVMMFNAPDEIRSMLSNFELL